MTTQFVFGLRQGAQPNGLQGMTNAAGNPLAHVLGRHMTSVCRRTTNGGRKVRVHHRHGPHYSDYEATLEVIE